MLLGILLILFLLLFVYVLWMPVVLYVNTITNEYYLHLKGLAKASIESHKEEVLIIKLKIFFLNFQFYPLRKKKDSAKKNKAKKHKVKRRKPKINLRTVFRTLKTFKVKRFVLNIDTGNCIYNAKLYPLFAFLNYKIGGFNINFGGRNQMVLHIQNRPWPIIKSIINI